MNNITLMGRLCAEPEYRTSASGEGFVRFRIAVDNYGKDADFFSCTAFKKTAENINKYFHKGDMIALVGSMHCQRTDKDGEKREWWSVTVDRFDFCGGKKETHSDDTVEVTPSDDSDLPF